jgi:hypothetical protein
VSNDFCVIVSISRFDFTNTNILFQRLLLSPKGSGHNRTNNESSSFSSSTELDHSISDQHVHAELIVKRIPQMAVAKMVINLYRQKSSTTNFCLISKKGVT